MYAAGEIENKFKIFLLSLKLKMVVFIIIGEWDAAFTMASIVSLLCVLSKHDLMMLWISIKIPTMFRLSAAEWRNGALSIFPFIPYDWLRLMRICIRFILFQSNGLSMNSSFFLRSANVRQYIRFVGNVSFNKQIQFIHIWCNSASGNRLPFAHRPQNTQSIMRYAREMRLHEYNEVSGNTKNFFFFYSHRRGNYYLICYLLTLKRWRIDLCSRTFPVYFSIKGNFICARKKH